MDKNVSYFQIQSNLLLSGWWKFHILVIDKRRVGYRKLKQSVCSKVVLVAKENVSINDFDNNCRYTPNWRETKVNLKNSFGYFAIKKDLVTQLYLNSVNALNKNI